MNRKAVFEALLAAVLFALSAPLGKYLLTDIPPMFMAGLLYLGAGIGITILSCFSMKKSKESGFTTHDTPWIVLMILLDVIAPFLLLWGLTLTSASNASLLFNFEMVATAIVARIFFKESIGKQLSIALILITLASIIISVDFNQTDLFQFSWGSLLVIAACSCWGLENNCTRNLSDKNPSHVVILKGIGSGTTAIIIALLTEKMVNLHWGTIVMTLLLGFVAYGLSIFFYVRAQRHLGASRTSIYYAAAPFIGMCIAFVMYQDPISINFIIGLILMLIGTCVVFYERHNHAHLHECITHNHIHSHNDLHHNHSHSDHSENPNPTHAHVHTHEAIEHTHPHTPDIHHRHSHE